MHHTGDFMFRRSWVVATLFLIAAVGLSAACNIGPTGLEEGTYPCESDDDCLTDDGFRCGDDGFCTTEIVTTGPPCDSSEPRGIDKDGDGYGTGGDRSQCVAKCEAEGGTNCDRFSAEDCDDNDADIHPNAPSKCDGKRNNCLLDAEDEAGVFACPGGDATTECPEALANEPDGADQFAKPECMSGRCVYAPFNEVPCTPDGASEPVKLTCENGTEYTWATDSSKTFADLPDGCP
jgi:hypothetical protein